MNIKEVGTFIETLEDAFGKYEDSVREYLAKSLVNNNYLSPYRMFILFNRLYNTYKPNGRIPPVPAVFNDYIRQMIDDNVPKEVQKKFEQKKENLDQYKNQNVFNHEDEERINQKKAELFFERQQDLKVIESYVKEFGLDDNEYIWRMKAYHIWLRAYFKDSEEYEKRKKEWIISLIKPLANKRSYNYNF